MIRYIKKSLLSDHTLTHKCMLRESYSFFLTTNTQQDPQLNLWNEVVIKVIKRDTLTYKMTYECYFVLHSMTTSQDIH